MADLGWLQNVHGVIAVVELDPITSQHPAACKKKVRIANQLSPGSIAISIWHYYIKVPSVFGRAKECAYYLPDQCMEYLVAEMAVDDSSAKCRIFL